MRLKARRGDFIISIFISSTPVLRRIRIRRTIHHRETVVKRVRNFIASIIAEDFFILDRRD